jgi:hypothetical protein
MEGGRWRSDWLKNGASSKTTVKPVSIGYVGVNI